MGTAKARTEVRLESESSTSEGSEAESEPEPEEEEERDSSRPTLIVPTCQKKRGNHNMLKENGQFGRTFCYQNSTFVDSELVHKYVNRLTLRLKKEEMSGR